MIALALSMFLRLGTPVVGPAECTTHDAPGVWATVCTLQGKTWVDTVGTTDRYWQRDRGDGSWRLEDAPCASGAWDPALAECIPCDEARGEGWIDSDTACTD